MLPVTPVYLVPFSARETGIKSRPSVFLALAVNDAMGPENFTSANVERIVRSVVPLIFLSLILLACRRTSAMMFANSAIF